MSAPETPDSPPLAGWALNYVPKRPAERVPLTPDASSVKPATTAAATGAAAPGGIFAIDVALFNSNARAAQLVNEMAAARYRAYAREIDLGDRGRMFEVMVGPFLSRAEADADLARIRARPGFEDARVVSSAP